MAVYRPTFTVETGAKREKRQSRVWWYEFTFAGKRVRESSGTTRKTIALEAEKQKRLDLERAYAGLPSESPHDRVRTVQEALKTYRAGYTVNHRDKSVLVVKHSSIHLERVFGGVYLSDLTQARILEYMEKRHAEEASNRTINLELEVLSRAIGYTWKALWPRVKKLEENHDAGRALEREEEKAILEAAARSDSHLIYPFLMTLAWTGMRSDEARMLRWCQVDFGANQITVGRSKTEAGKGRQIPMSAALRFALEHHVSWLASKLGPVQPGWYVFPKSNRRLPVDGTEPVTSLKRAWEGARKRAKVECRLHDLRHSFCTKMAEAGVPETTMLDMMGHVSAAMLRRYSHIRAQARREAISALEDRQNSVGVLQESLQETEKRVPIKPVSH